MSPPAESFANDERATDVQLRQIRETLAAIWIALSYW